MYLDLKLRPPWVSEKIWQTLTPKEKTYCLLRHQNANDTSIQDFLQIRSPRTYRYFRLQMRKLLFPNFAPHP